MTTKLITLLLLLVSSAWAQGIFHPRLIQQGGASTNQCLVWSGSVWAPAACTTGGGITSLGSQTGATQTFATDTTGTDFTIDSTSNVHTFRIPTASGTARGLLASADWTTFNGKESVLTFNSPLSRSTNTIDLSLNATGPGLVNSTGLSLIRSCSDGQSLSYTAASGWACFSPLTTLNTLTGLSQTFATGSSGTDFGISSSGSTHTFNLPTASATNRGLLSTTDWSDFDSKLDGTAAASGDLSGNYPSPTVAKVNGVSYDAAPSDDQVPVMEGGGAMSYKSIADCDDTGGNHLNYDTATNTFSCGTSGATDLAAEPFVTTAASANLSAEKALPHLLEYNPLAYPSSANAMDDEFTAGLSGIWTEVSSAGASITKTSDTPGEGWLRITFGGTGDAWLALQAIPVDDFVIVGRCGVSATTVGTTGFPRCGLVVTGGTTNTDDLYQLVYDTNNGIAVNRTVVEYLTAIDTFSATKGSTMSGGIGLYRTMYYRISRVTATYTFEVSEDGISYRPNYVGTISEFTPTHVGIKAQAGGVIATTQVFIDLFRRTP